MLKNRRNIWIIVGVTVVVIVAIVLVIASVRSQSSSASAAYQTTTVQIGTLTSTVEGAGTVASAQSANLAWQTSGQVEKVNTQVGQVVKAGDVLASLSPASLSSNILQAQVDVVNAQRNLDDVLNSGTAAANAQLALVNAQKAFDTAKANKDRLNIPRAEPGTIEYYQSQVVLAEQNVQRAQTAYDATNGLSDANPTRANAYTNLYNAQLQLDEAQGNYNYVTGKPSSTDQATVLANYAVAEAALKDAQITWDRLKDGPDANDVKAAQATLQAAQNIANSQYILAPFDGTITQVSVSPGDVIATGTKAFRIDNLSRMVVSVPVIEIDVNNVRVGQPATFTLDAIPNKIYNGKVIQVDLAGTVAQTSVTFNATVELTDADAQIKPGMAANVTITTNQVANALLVPTTAIFTDSNGQPYVYLVQNGTPAVVNVTVGAVSSTTTQITSDTLKEGDTIVLSFASTTSSGGGFGFGGGVVRGGGAGNVQPVGTP
jgi:HlyD family secretion protein